jgi:alkylation response protein AidB-like acyl-CoA dehydrogenase
LQTQAVRDGDEYVINGQKVFTSLASGADYIWLAVRTNTEVKKHKGISIIIVPTDTPGLLVRPDRQLRRVNTNITYYEDVRVPAATSSARRTAAGGSSPTSSTTSASRCARRVWSSACSTTRALGAGDEARRRPRVIDQEWVQVNLARVHAKLEFLRLANWRSRGSRRAAPREPGRRVDDQGLRHRVLHGGGAAADGGHARPGDAPGRLAGRGARGSRRDACCARCTSSPSAAAPTRCNET